MLLHSAPFERHFQFHTYLLTFQGPRIRIEKTSCLLLNQLTSTMEKATSSQPNAQRKSLSQPWSQSISNRHRSSNRRKDPFKSNPNSSHASTTAQRTPSNLSYLSPLAPELGRWLAGLLRPRPAASAMVQRQRTNPPVQSNPLVADLPALRRRQIGRGWRVVCCEEVAGERLR